MNLHLTGIWGWLLRPLFAMCMLGFASSAISLGGDEGGAEIAGGGEGGGYSEGGDGEGDGGGSEEDLGAGDEDFEESGQNGSGERTQLTPQQRADAAREKTLSPGVKKALAGIKETDPKTADVLRKAVFASQAWTQVLPGGIRQAREMAQTFEEVGGVEGIQGLRDEAQSLQSELDNVDEQWKSANPQFIASLAEQDPEAFAKAAPVILDQLQKTDKASYNSVLGRIFYNTLNQAQVMNQIQQAYNLAIANKAAPGMAGVIEGLKGLWEWTEGIRELASTQPSFKPDKERERLKKERQDFDNEKFQGFKAEVGQGMRTHVESGILREVGKLLKPLNISLKALQVKDKDRFMSVVAEADRRLAEALKADKDFQKQKDRLVATRDKARVLKFYQQKIDYLLADPRGPRIALAVKKIFFNGAKAQPRPGGERQGSQNNGTQNQNQGNGQQRRTDGGQRREQPAQAMRVASRPAAENIDYARTSDDMILDGKAFLKTGKQVQWR